MTILDKKCITRKLYSVGKTRIVGNHKRKSQKKIREMLSYQPDKYFTQKELYTINCNNDNDIYKKILRYLDQNPTKSQASKSLIHSLDDLRKNTIKNIGGINSVTRHIDYLVEYSIKNKKRDYEEFNDTYAIYTELKKNYKNFYMDKNCERLQLLDVEKLAEPFDFFDIQNVLFDPSKSKISFCVDFIGNRNYYFFVKDIINKSIELIDLVPEKHEHFISIHDTFGKNLGERGVYNTVQISDNYCWIDNESIVFISYNSYYNTTRCYSYHIPSRTRRLLFNETRSRMLSILPVDSGFYFLLYSSSYNDDEVYVLDVQEKNLDTHKKKLYMDNVPIFKSTPYVKYEYLNHMNATWYVLKTIRSKSYFYSSRDLKHFKVLRKFTNPYDVITTVYPAMNHFVFFIQQRGNYRVEIYNYCSPDSSQGFKLVKRLAPNEVCGVKNSCHIQPLLPAPVLHNNNEIMFQNTSFTTIGDLFSIKFNHGPDAKIQVTKVPLEKKYVKLYNSKYSEKTLFLKNNTIMITILYSKGTQLKNRKCLVLGYGSYGTSYDSKYNFNKFNYLCDLGFIVVIAHISGDNKLGFNQYYNGIHLRKKNTFTDFIYICDYLVQRGITKKERLAIWGRSAGGLLISTVINMRPDLCELAILGVPFLTPLITLSSNKFPLGYESHSEWGDPRNKTVKKYIKSYSPIDNIQKCAKYPNVLIYANLNDTLTPFKETLTYYNLMKEVDVYKNKERDLNVYLDERFGHVQGTKLYDHNFTFAMIFATLEKYIH